MSRGLLRVTGGRSFETNVSAQSALPRRGGVYFHPLLASVGDIPVIWFPFLSLHFVRSLGNGKKAPGWHWRWRNDCTVDNNSRRCSRSRTARPLDGRTMLHIALTHSGSFIDPSTAAAAIALDCSRSSSSAALMPNTFYHFIQCFSNWLSLLFPFLVLSLERDQGLEIVRCTLYWIWVKVRNRENAFTQYGEDGRIADSFTGNVLCHARIVAHVGQSGLNDKQMSLRADNQVASLFLRFDDNTVAHPRHVRWWNAFRRQTPQLHLTFELNVPRIWVFRKMFPYN